MAGTVDPQAQLSLETRIRACRICREAPIGQPLAHEPRPVLQFSPTARLLIASQAPGVRAQASGRPFSDASGVRLRTWLGLDEATFYDAGRVAIVPMGFCFPGHDAKGGDLPPRPECAATWHGQIWAALPALRLVLAVGLYAQRHHLARLGLAAGPTVADTVRHWRTLAAAHHAATPPILAQQRVDRSKSMVRGRAFAGPARQRRRGARVRVRPCGTGRRCPSAGAGRAERPSHFRRCRWAARPGSFSSC